MLPPIFVINLDRDIERMAHMRRQLDLFGLSYRRFAALSGAEAPARLRSLFNQVALTDGEIGCYVSHLLALEQAVALDTPVLVLEDDVALAADFVSCMTWLAGVLPRDWDIVRLSYPTKRAVVSLAEFGVRRLVRYTHVPLGTGGYLISPGGAKKFLAQRRRQLSIDEDLRRVWSWNLNTFGVSPPPLVNDVFEKSSIDAMSDGPRISQQRYAALKRQRFVEAPLRFMRGVGDCGLGPWLTAERENLLRRIRRSGRRLRQAPTGSDLRSRLAPR